MFSIGEFSLDTSNIELTPAQAEAFRANHPRAASGPCLVRIPFESPGVPGETLIPGAYDSYFLVAERPSNLPACAESYGPFSLRGQFTHSFSIQDLMLARYADVSYARTLFGDHVGILEDLYAARANLSDYEYFGYEEPNPRLEAQLRGRLAGLEFRVHEIAYDASVRAFLNGSGPQEAVHYGYAPQAMRLGIAQSWVIQFSEMLNGDRPLPEGVTRTHVREALEMSLIERTEALAEFTDTNWRTPTSRNTETIPMEPVLDSNLRFRLDMTPEVAAAWEAYRQAAGRYANIGFLDLSRTESAISGGEISLSPEMVRALQQMALEHAARAELNDAAAELIRTTEEVPPRDAGRQILEEAGLRARGIPDGPAMRVPREASESTSSKPPLLPEATDPQRAYIERVLDRALGSTNRGRGPGEGGMQMSRTKVVPFENGRPVISNDGTIALADTNSSDFSNILARLHNPLRTIRYAEIGGHAQMIAGGAALDFTIQRGLLPANASPVHRSLGSAAVLTGLPAGTWFGERTPQGILHFLSHPRNIFPKRGTPFSIHAGSALTSSMAFIPISMTTHAIQQDIEQTGIRLDPEVKVGTGLAATVGLGTLAASLAPTVASWLGIEAVTTYTIAGASITMPVGMITAAFMICGALLVVSAGAIHLIQRTTAFLQEHPEVRNMLSDYFEEEDLDNAHAFLELFNSDIESARTQMAEEI